MSRVAVGVVAAASDVQNMLFGLRETSLQNGMARRSWWMEG